MKPEGLKFEAEGREREWGSWGGGSEPPPHQLGGLGSAVSSPSGVRGGAPKKNGFWCILGLNLAVFAS